MDFFLDGICHRGGDAPLMLCFRCTCVYSSFLLGLLYWGVVLTCRRENAGAPAIISNAAVFIGMGILGFAQVFGWVSPGRTVTTAAAYMFGISMSFFMSSLIRNRLVLTPPGRRRPLPLEILPHLLALSVAAMILGEIQGVLRTAALLAPVGAALAFILANTILFMELFRKTLSSRTKLLTASLLCAIPASVAEIWLMGN